jgi:hypothetical protein
MADELSILSEGEDYVLRRDLGDGSGSEIVLSEANVLFLARLVPGMARQILAPKALAGGHVLTSAATPAQAYKVFLAVHDEVLILRFQDEYEADHDFSLTATDARAIADSLVKEANKLDNRPKAQRQ